MRKLFHRAGIDFDQWRALTSVLLKLDFRSSSIGSHPGQQVSPAAALFVQFIFYTLVGLGVALFLAFARDLFIGGIFAMTVTMVLIGTAVLLDHNAAIVSPSDYGTLGFRPITSRTYFAVRLTNVLVYMLALTTVAAWMPVAAMFIRYGAVVGLAGVVAFYACSTMTALAILMGYGTMLRAIGPNAVKRALSYVQLVMSILVYGGYMLMSRFVSKSLVSSVALAKTPWLLLFPATWFVAYLELAAGRIGPMEIIAAALSLLALAAMVSGLRGRLSLDYSAQLGAMLTATGSRHRGSEKGVRPLLQLKGVRPLFRAGEARAVALLVRSQFHNDQRFRMGVLGILPLTLLYVLMGVRDGAVADPFVETSRHGPSLVTMAVMLFPSALKQHLTQSEAFRASWVFFACPIDRMKVVRASKDVLVAFFLVPYLAFLTVLFTYFAGNLVHVAVHIALLGCLGHLVLQLALFLDPALPFSRPPARKGQNAVAFFGLMIGIMILANLLQVFSAQLYASRAATVTAFSLVLLVSVGVDRLTRARVQWQTGSLEFEG